MMNPLKFVFILFFASSIGKCSKPMIDGQSQQRLQIDDRIDQIPKEIDSICALIGDKMMPEIKIFQSLINDAHGMCPDFSNMEKDLTNIAVKADAYSVAIEEALYQCQQQSKMLKNGLESTAIFMFYLNEGNYSLASDIVDNWHQSFENFSAKFAVWHIPMNILLNNQKTFYHNSWFRGIVTFIVRTGSTLFGSAAIAFILTSLMLRCGLFDQWEALFRHPEQQQQQPQAIHGNPTAQTNTENQTQSHTNTGFTQNPSNVTQHQTQQDARTTTNRHNNPQPLSTHGRMPHYTSIGFIFFSCLAIILNFNPEALSLPRSERYNWYPNATTTLESMKNDMHVIQKMVSQQTTTFVDLQSYVALYLNETFQNVVKEFVTDLFHTLRQADTELLDAYAEGIKLDNAISKAYESIETKAKKTGKTEVVKSLLKDLNIANDQVVQLYHHLHTAVNQQRQILPLLKKQTQSMRGLLRNRRVFEIGEIAEEQIEQVVHMDGQLHKVKVKIQHVFSVIGAHGNAGVGKKINGLEKDAEDEQYKSMLAGFGSLVGGGVGLVATKVGISMVTIVAAPAVVPAVGAAAALASVGLAGFGAIKNFLNHRNEGDFKGELKDLEIFFDNFITSMKALEKVTAEQTRSLESSRSSLSKLSRDCGRFHRTFTMRIPVDIERGISQELDTLITEYTRLIAKLSLFDEHLPTTTKRIGQQ